MDDNFVLKASRDRVETEWLQMPAGALLLRPSTRTLAPAPALAPALVPILTLTPTLTRCKEGWHGRPGRRLSPLSPREGCRRLPPQRPTARRKPPGRSRLWSCLRARRLCRGPRRCGGAARRAVRRTID